MRLPPIFMIIAAIKPDDKKGANGRVWISVACMGICFRLPIPFRAKYHIITDESPIISPTQPMGSPRTKPPAAVSLISPPPMPPSLIRAAAKSGRANRIPNSFTGVNVSNPVRKMRLQRKSGMIRQFKSNTEATIKKVTKRNICIAGRLSRIVEHFLDTTG